MAVPVTVSDIEISTIKTSITCPAGTLDCSLCIHSSDGKAIDSRRFSNYLSERFTAVTNNHIFKAGEQLLSDVFTSVGASKVKLIIKGSTENSNYTLSLEKKEIRRKKRKRTEEEDLEE